MDPEHVTTRESDDLPVSIFDEHTRLERGFKMVATTRSNDEDDLLDEVRDVPKHRMYYEIHGDRSPDSQRFVWIMGLSNSCFGWNLQVQHFASLPRHQCLVFDNRGVGSSDSPKGLYQVREMAKDVVELLEQVGWIDKNNKQGDRQKLNVVGVSMGGMCALELATLVPDHINALMLTSTKSGTKGDLPTWKVTYTFGRILTGTVWSPEAGVALITDMLFPKEYLDQIHPTDPEKRTRRQVHEQDFLRRYKLTRRQTMTGRLGQLAAVFKHHVSQDRLLEIAETVPRIGIITGDQDNLVNPERSRDLHKDLPGSTLKVVKGAGHALPAQIPEEYNEWIKSVLAQPATNKR
ncbi:hypothetical protein OIV83_004627 [Microbotryomycetes sp. JL201]|nr:hypothetical protein OIV83_004627 [Microbotryomycetes sp. JL201]